MEFKILTWRNEIYQVISTKTIMTLFDVDKDQTWKFYSV